ncbi:hypothetical protein [Isoptericola rhizosphaerae]|uniref:hypothetical protein n=1 Tax=Isoptericola rhizosphaerae TaxID=3377837 RepID=UPI00383A6B59
MGYTEADYLDLTPAQAARQWRSIIARAWPAKRNQVDYVPVETLLCVATMFVVEHSRFGGESKALSLSR